MMSTQTILGILVLVLVFGCVGGPPATPGSTIANSQTGNTAAGELCKAINDSVKSKFADQQPVTKGVVSFKGKDYCQIEFTEDGVVRNEYYGCAAAGSKYMDCVKDYWIVTNEDGVLKEIHFGMNDQGQYGVDTYENGVLVEN